MAQAFKQTDRDRPVSGTFQFSAISLRTVRSKAPRLFGTPRNAHSVNGFDRDGDLDLSLVFDTAQSGIDAGDTQACLTGRLTSARQFSGCDAIVMR